MFSAMIRDTNPASASSPVNIFDVSGLADLKRQAKAGDPAANKVVAKQFEALFLQMVLKSMRDATPSEGLFDSEQTRMYESLLDQQLGQALGGSTRGTGLAAMIEAQLAHGKSGPLGMAYDRAEFMEQRRQMMQAWADYLDRLRDGAQVIPIKAA